jgi:thiol:disulfide interchange protein DsbD
MTTVKRRFTLCLITLLGLTGLGLGQTHQPSQDSGLAEYIIASIKSGNFALVALGLLLVGLVINLTPCVYPMISITIAFFTKQAGENKRARFGLGLFYMLGIAITYGLVGGVAASLGTAFAALFSKPWFLYTVAAIMIGLSLSMFGLYQIGIPPFLAKYLRGRSGVVGSFIMGTFVGVSTAPCSGPLLVAVFAEIAKLQNILLGVLLFSLVGLGLGLPYLLLALFTSGVKALPKAGAWMETVENILGFVVMGIGLHYILLALPNSMTEYKAHYIWAGYYGIAAFYMIFRKCSSASKIQNLIRGTAILTFGFLSGACIEMDKLLKYKASAKMARHELDWDDFTAITFEQAKKSGKPILIDVWADWCKVCKEIDQRIFEEPRALEALKDVQILRIDWSANSHDDIDAYMDFTQKLFRMPGPPYFIFMKPGGKIVAEVATISNIDDLKSKLKKAGVEF